MASGGYTPTATSGMAPMPGGYQGNQFQTPRSYTSGPPVIPDKSLYRDYPDDDALSSVDTLTTPPPSHRPPSRTHSRVSSLDTLMTPPPGRTHRSSIPEANWASATQAAADAIPVPASVINAIPPGVYSSPALTSGNGGGSGNSGGNNKGPAATRKKGKKR
jgi:hypothetical protein